jgi:hypothetical protein
MVLLTLRLVEKYLVSAPQFGQQQDFGLVEYPAIDEASGIAASRSNTGVLWTHNDSGDGPHLFAMNEQGRHLGRYTVADARARDWEDIAIGPGPDTGKQYIYIGDIGDNNHRRPFVRVYRIAEPEVLSTQSPVEIRLSGVQEIRLKLPDKSRDCEALMVDPLTGDIYLITKRERKVSVYRAAYPHATGAQLNQLVTITRLDLSDVVAADISSSGLEVLLKTYSGVYYWQRTPRQTMEELFKKRPVALPYVLEPQGEAICWNADGSGYFTLSEELAGVPARLYYYARTATPGSDDESLQAGHMALINQTVNFALYNAMKLSYRITSLVF